MKRMRGHILVTGGLGFIGRHLTARLVREGYEVTVVDQYVPEKKMPGVHYVLHDIQKKWNADLLESITGIINLAGVSIFGRWTPSYQQAIYDSRILGTRALLDACSTLAHPPRVFVSASAIGYYGDTGTYCVYEDAPSGKDFLAHVTRDWEQEATRAEEIGMRTVIFRTSHVLGRGGFLGPLFTPFRLGLGAWFGNGENYLSWVHIDDLVHAYVFALDEVHELSGIYNIAAAECIPQKKLLKAFGQILNRPVWLSLPLILMRLRYGDFADVLTASQCVSSDKIRDKGYEFHYDTLDFALQEIVQKFLQQTYEKK
jgi:uncharacterized protein